MNTFGSKVFGGCLAGLLFCGAALGDRAIKVALVLYDAPSGESTTSNPYLLQTQVTEYAQLTPGSTVYLEAWVSTVWEGGLTGAGLDVNYPPDIFFTYCNPNELPVPDSSKGTCCDAQTCLEDGLAEFLCHLNWGADKTWYKGRTCADLYPCLCTVELGDWDAFPGCPVFSGVPSRICSASENQCNYDTDCPAEEDCIDNPAKDCVPVPGVVQNVGGNNLTGIPPAGMWERVATISFDVLATPTDPVAFVSGQDETWPEGGDLMFAFFGGGEALPSEIEFFDWVVPGGADDDDDGVYDAMDNCPGDYNPGQIDDDSDSVGNVCDNCTYIPNTEQQNSDGDLPGDVCDNCPNIPNSDQQNSDSDILGDACDNCPTVDNPGQEDANGNGIGDFCDPRTIPAFTEWGVVVMVLLLVAAAMVIFVRVQQRSWA